MDEEIPNLGPRKKLAKFLAQKLLKESKIAEAPVSLQIIIEHLQKTHNLDVRRVNIGEKVSGLLVVCKELDEEYATIGFNSNHPWCRRRFTIAHEIGHLLLGHTCAKAQMENSYNEKEANIFAGELLIPKALIKKDYKKCPNLQEVSKLYRVSDQAMTIKLLDARLV